MPSTHFPNIDRILAEKPLMGTERKILLIVIASIFSTALFTVFIFYRFLVYDFNDRILNRSEAIFSLLLSRIPAQSVIELNNPEDANTEAYQKIHALLDGIRKTTVVRYLYTAKLGNDGHPIYIVDGLSPEVEDFRAIGAPIEGEIVPIVARCLDGQAVHGPKAMETSWGTIMPTCKPIKQGDITVGALVIEFDVQSFVDNTHRSILICLAFSFGVAIVVTMVTAWLLKKLSAPLYRKLAYTDLLTGVFNRNAFELDIRHITNEKRDGLVVLCSDINLLKTINDQAGHAAGDAHIRVFARLLRYKLKNFGQTYRTGGDEFTALLHNITMYELNEKMEKLQSITQNISIKGFQLAFSYGMAQFDPAVDDTVHATLKRADLKMYSNKNKTRLLQDSFQVSETPR